MFTDEEKAFLLYNAGWSGESLNPQSLWYSKRIEDIFNNASESVVNYARKWITRGIEIEDQQFDSRKRMKATSIGRGDIELNNREINQLEAEKKRILKRLFAYLVFPVNTKGPDIFY